MLTICQLRGCRKHYKTMRAQPGVLTSYGLMSSSPCPFFCCDGIPCRTRRQKNENSALGLGVSRCGAEWPMRNVGELLAFYLRVFQRTFHSFACIAKTVQFVKGQRIIFYFGVKARCRLSSFCLCHSACFRW